ncbi:hypothetical protein QF042_003621 [Pedobacter sp. W3I1]|uniref:putative glycolipid-binding domain-containing protein n=1 Tax=Pedobacter sp. W3I1 TaxID=3042291 RepID=UPI002788E9F7|nr:putative glycolipid-binding domain-containing protein [Pedobacter sp. W3I1]MDQ0640056.1 hypothetical protein [Pedobacter sp. W3I1]
MKIKNIIWKGLHYNSIENCVINVGAKSINIDSSIIGYIDNAIYKVDYTIHADTDWNTISFGIKSKVNGITNQISGQKIGNLWKIDGDYQDGLANCTDIDISLTPFTNSLPINRLHLNQNQQMVIDVLYINILEHKIMGVQQKYTRLAEKKYHYQNIENDFESVIEVDNDGFVIDYPRLFERGAII